MRPYPPLGPRYVASYLESKGFRAEWFDSTFKRDTAAFEIELSRRHPRVVGLHAHLATREKAVEMVACARKFGAAVIAGGPDATRHPDFYLQRGVDVVVRGEGEETAAELLPRLRQASYRVAPSLLQEVRGVSFRDGNRRIDTPDRPILTDLDSLPWPTRPVEHKRAYMEQWRIAHGYTAVSMTSSRGVPGTPEHRRRHPGKVAEEMNWLRATFDPDKLRFCDPVYTSDPLWHGEVAESLRKMRLRQPFNCLGRPQDLSESVAKDLARAGCYRVALDVPTGSRKLLARRDPGFAVEDVYRGTRHLREAGIDLALFIHLGLPGESKEDVRATLEMVEVLDPQIFGVSVTDREVAEAVPGLIAVTDASDEGGPRYGADFYRWALRLLTARMTVRRGRAEGKGLASWWREAAATPLYEAAFRVYLPRLPRWLDRKDPSPPRK